MTTLDALKTELYFGLPENKIELIDEQLIVANDLKNSLSVLQLILAGWGADTAVAMTLFPLWWDALRTVYFDLLPPALRMPNSAAYVEDWRAWAEPIPLSKRLTRLP